MPPRPGRLAPCAVFQNFNQDAGGPPASRPLQGNTLCNALHSGLQFERCSERLGAAEGGGHTAHTQLRLNGGEPHAEHAMRKLYAAHSGVQEGIQKRTCQQGLAA